MQLAITLGFEQFVFVGHNFSVNLKLGSCPTKTNSSNPENVIANANNTIMKRKNFSLIMILIVTMFLFSFVSGSNKRLIVNNVSKPPSIKTILINSLEDTKKKVIPKGWNYENMMNAISADGEKLILSWQVKECKRETYNFETDSTKWVTTFDTSILICAIEDSSWEINQIFGDGQHWRRPQRHIMFPTKEQAAQMDEPILTGNFFGGLSDMGYWNFQSKPSLNEVKAVINFWGWMWTNEDGCRILEGEIHQENWIRFTGQAIDKEYKQ